VSQGSKLFLVCAAALLCKRVQGRTSRLSAPESPLSLSSFSCRRSLHIICAISLRENAALVHCDNSSFVDCSKSIFSSRASSGVQLYLRDHHHDSQQKGTHQGSCWAPQPSPGTRYPLLQLRFILEGRDDRLIPQLKRRRKIAHRGKTTH